MEEEEETGCVASGLRLNNFLNAVHRLEEEEKDTKTIAETCTSFGMRLSFSLWS